MKEKVLTFVFMAVAFLVLLSCEKAYCDPSLFASTSSTETAGATTLVSPSFTDTNTGDLILLYCASQFNFAVSTFTAPATNSGLTLKSGVMSLTQIGGVAIYYACTGAGGFSAKTFTCNWTGTGPAALHLQAWSGTACTNASPVLGIGSSKACNGTTGTTGACVNTTSAANSWVVGNGEDPDNSGAPVAGSGQTMKQGFNDSGNAEKTWALIQTAATAASGTSVTMSITNVTSGDRWNTTWLEILAAASGGGAVTPNNRGLFIKGGKMSITGAKVTVQ